MEEGPSLLEFMGRGGGGKHSEKGLLQFRRARVSLFDHVYSVQKNTEHAVV